MHPSVQGDWSFVAEKYKVTFAQKTFWGPTDVKGTYAKVRGSPRVEGSLISAEAVIEATSVDTKTTTKYDHLWSPDFLNIDSFTTIKASIDFAPFTLGHH